jgi:hypothetical protein
MADPVLVTAVPVVVGAALIERWRRRAVARHRAGERQVQRRLELFNAIEGEYDPERDGT